MAVDLDILRREIAEARARVVYVYRYICCLVDLITRSKAFGVTCKRCG